MKNIKKVLIIALCFLIFMSIEVLANEDLVLTEYQEYTDEYIEYMQLSDEEKNQVIEPRKYKLHNVDAGLVGQLPNNKAAVFESYFSLKSIIPENVVVRNQKSTGSCWAFSTISLLETNLAMQNYRNNKPAKVYDFSELHVEYSSLHFYKNNQTKKPYGYNRALGSGGNFAYASSYLMSGQGAIEEASLPFEDYTLLTGYVDPNYANVKTDAIIDIANVTNKKVIARAYDTVEYMMPSNQTEIDELTIQMKTHLKNYGALSASIYISNASTNYTTGAIYNNSSNLSNHEIAIIGWDDSYAISNFNSSYRPNAPGAWIIKNSWGTYSGDNGIFYVSYEDPHIYRAVNGITSSTDQIDYDNIYQYDYLYPNSFFIPNSSYDAITIGEEFTKKTSETELLNEVSLYIINKCDCELYVGKSRNNLSRVTLEGGATSKTLSETGYHTLKFKDAVEITTDTFFVAIKMKTTNSAEIMIPFESKNNNSAWQYAEDGNAFATAYTNYSIANWLDFSNIGDMTIKAYTKKKPIVETPPSQNTNTNTNINTNTTTNTNTNTNNTVTIPFKDVSKTAWYYEAVKYVYQNHIITGTSSTTFDPNMKLSRGMVVTILHRMEGSPAVSGKTKFPDVQNSKEYYYSAVKWATDNKIVSGYSTGNFGPNDNITREDLAVILNKYAKYKGKDTSKTNDLSGFTDTHKISNYALTQIKWAVGAGVITGNADKTLNPKGASTRAEAAAMFEKYCKRVGR